MIDFIKVAFSGGMLPLTLLIGAIALYWLLSVLGVVAMDMLDFDVDLDADGGATAGGAFQSSLRYIGAGEVPVVAALSFLGIFMWGSSMVGQFVWNPQLDLLRGISLSAASLVPAVLLTKVATIPMRPFFRSLKGTEGESKPVIGRVGKVRSRTLDQQSGQVEVASAEAPLLINARLAPDAKPLDHGAEVVITSYDPEKGTYLVSSPENITP